MNIKAIMTVAAAKVRNNTPLILTGVAVVGVVATTVLAAKAGPKAKLIDDNYRYDNRGPDLPNGKTPFRAYVKNTWKVWTPVAGAAGVTIAAVILSHGAHQKQYASLMGLYVLGSKAFDELVESVDEVTDEKTKTAIKSRASEKAMARDEETLVNVSNLIHETICFDMYSGRYFRSDMESIRRAENDFNSDMLNTRYGSLNEFYSRLGLDGIGAGEDIGWNSDEIMMVGYNSVLTPSGQPALSIDFHESMPKHDYYSN